MNIIHNLQKKFNAPRCPGCGKRIAPDSNFCYACCHFLTENKTHLLPAESVTGAEIQKVLMLHDKEPDIKYEPLRCKLSKILFGLSVFVFILAGVNFLFELNEFFAYFVGAVVLFLLHKMIEPHHSPYRLNEEQQTCLVEEYIVPQELHAILGNEISYQPQETLPKAIIEKYRFYTRDFDKYEGSQTRDFDKYEGSQLVTATYHGVQIMMSLVHLQYIIETDDSSKKNKSPKKNRKVRRSDVMGDLFNGHCLYAETNLRPTAGFCLYDKDYWHLWNREIDKDISDFDNVIYFDATNRKAVNAMLTPSLREKLLRLRQKNCCFCVILQPNGHLLIAIRDINKIELSAKHLEESRYNIRRNFTYVIQLLDILLSECPK